MDRALAPGDPITLELGDLKFTYGAMSFRDYRNFMRDIKAEIDDEDEGATRWLNLASRHLKKIENAGSDIPTTDLEGIVGIDEVPRLALAFREAHFVSHDEKKSSESPPTSTTE